MLALESFLEDGKLLVCRVLLDLTVIRLDYKQVIRKGRSDLSNLAVSCCPNLTMILVLIHTLILFSRLFISERLVHH